MRVLDYIVRPSPCWCGEDSVIPDGSVPHHPSRK